MKNYRDTASSADSALEGIHRTLSEIRQDSKSLTRPVFGLVGQLVIGLVVAIFGYRLDATGKQAAFASLQSEAAMWVYVAHREGPDSVIWQAADRKFSAVVEFAEKIGNAAVASAYNDRAMLYDGLGRACKRFCVLSRGS